MLLQDLVWGIILLLRVTAAVDLRTRMAMKVWSSFPEEIESCLIDTRNFQTNIVTGCARLCKMNHPCFLACQDENGQCRLYSAIVSQNWNGSGISLGECYSYWADRRDLAGSATASSSSIQEPHTLPKNAIDGFACARTEEFRFEADKDSYEYFRANFGSPVCVSKVMILMRDHHKYETFFNNIEVRVGDQPGNDKDFSGNPLLMNYEGPAESGEIVVFEQETTLTGRYVSVQKLNTKDDHFIFNEIKIIGC